jgi:uncharacterized membrane protein YeaQ/YmgE (transglycosylase-associated protein family)
LAELVVWVIVGVLAGSLAGTVVTGKWGGLGRWTGLGVGLVGALIGGLIFSLFGIWPGLDAIDISLRDIVSAFVSSVIFLLLLWIVRRRNGGVIEGLGAQSEGLYSVCLSVAKHNERGRLVTRGDCSTEEV